MQNVYLGRKFEHRVGYEMSCYVMIMIMITSTAPFPHHYPKNHNLLKKADLLETTTTPTPKCENHHECSHS